MKHSKIIITFFINLFFIFSSCAADFDSYFPHLIKAEGVIFTISQYDRGGATKYGVTLKTYQIACMKVIAISCDKNKDGKVSAADLALTSQTDIKPIYKAMYWNHVNATLIHNQGIAESIVDILVNCGPGKNNKNVKTIQKMVGANPDGIFGKETIRKINQSDSKILYRKIHEYRTHYYKAIAVGDQINNLRGWLNRINNLKRIHENERYI